MVQAINFSTDAIQSRKTKLLLQQRSIKYDSYSTE